MKPPSSHRTLYPRSRKVAPMRPQNFRCRSRARRPRRARTARRPLRDARRPLVPSAELRDRRALFGCRESAACRWRMQALPPAFHRGRTSMRELVVRRRVRIRIAEVLNRAARPVIRRLVVHLRNAHVVFAVDRPDEVIRDERVPGIRRMDAVVAQQAAAPREIAADRRTDRRGAVKVLIRSIAAGEAVEDLRHRNERDAALFRGQVDTLIDDVVERLNLARKRRRDVVTSQAAPRRARRRKFAPVSRGRESPFRWSFRIRAKYRAHLAT